MGLSPRDVDAMSPWQFNACVSGFVRAQGKGAKTSPGELSDDELRNMGVKGF